MPTASAYPFGTLLKRYRTEAALTQEELAEQAGLSLRGLAALEIGERLRPHKVTIRMLADALRLAGEERAAFEAAGRGRGSAESRDTSALPLLGRARELELLEWHLTGRGARVLALAGEPGIGKTRLLRHAAERAAQQGQVVIAGGCQRRSLQEPYAPLPGALAQHLGAIPSPELREAVRGCDWLVRLLPELSSMLGEPTVPGMASPEQERRLVFGAVGHLMANLGGPSGVLLVLDDLQWAPVDALDLLTALMYDPAARGLHVLCAYRSTDVRPHDPLAVVLADLAHAGFARQHTVEALSEHEAKQLLESLIEESRRGAPAVEQAVRRTGGVPFYLVSYAQELRLQPGGPLPAEGLPWDVTHSIRQRVAALPETTQEVLGMAAVAGRVVPYALLQAVAAHPEQDVLAALEGACEARLLLEYSDRAYQFAHDLVREVVEADLGVGRRVVLHRVVAEALEARPGEPPVEELAFHYARSDHPERALPHLISAAEQASVASAYQQEAALLAQAIELALQVVEADQLGELHARRGKALFALTRWPEARTEMEQALEHLPAERAERRAEILTNLALSCHWVSEAVATRRYATEALSLAQTLGREDLAVGAMSALVLADSSDADLHGALKRYRHVAGQAPDRHRATLVPGTELASLIQYWQADFEEAAATAREAIEIGRAVNDTSTVARALGNLGCALTGAGRYDQALQVFTEVQEFCREQGATNWLARSTAMRGGLHLELFDFDRAEALAEEARELSRSANWMHATISGGIDLLLNFTRRGETGRAEQLVEEVREGVAGGQGAHGWLWKLRFAQVQAELALAHGQYTNAVRQADYVIAESRRLGRIKYEVAGQRARARALVAQGRAHAAIVDLGQAVERARNTGDPAMFLPAAAALLALDGTDALLAEARATLDRVVDALPNAELRARFLEAEPVRLIASSAVSHPS